jgi:cell division protein FtsA
MGAATTSLAVFEEGDLIHLAVFPIGSANITNDIAIGLKTEVAIAESVKKQHGTCMFAKTGIDKKDQSRKKIEVFSAKGGSASGGDNSLNFTKKDLVDIIEPRVSEILELVQKELKKINRQELLPGGVVLTGGGAKIAKIKELTKETLKLACEIGTPKGIVGLQDDPALATVVGLVLEGVDSGRDGGILDLTQGWWARFKKWLKNFIP